MSTGGIVPPGETPKDFVCGVPAAATATILQNFLCYDLANFAILNPALFRRVTDTNASKASVPSASETESSNNYSGPLYDYKKTKSYAFMKRKNLAA